MSYADPEALRLILEHYERGATERRDEDRWWIADGAPLADALGRAARALWADDTIHSHHRRPGKAVMRNLAEVVVAAARPLQRATDFDDLLRQVEALTARVKSAGELVAYDVADRIGLRLGLAPQRVYLHAGTRAGARVLGLGTAPRTRSIAVQDLPSPLDMLSPRDAENVLCSYKRFFLMSPEDCLHALAAAPGLRRSGSPRRGC